MQRIRKTSQEREAWLCLAIAASEIHAALPVIEPWLRQTKAWGPLKGASAIVNKMLNRLGDTIPDDQYKTLYNRLKGSELKLIPKAAAKPEGWWMLTERQLDVLCRTIRDDTCSMCTNDYDEARKCELRRVLDTLPLRVRDVSGGECPFALTYVEGQE